MVSQLHLSPQEATRKPGTWPAFQARLVEELERQERRWFERGEQELNDRCGEIADQALIDTQVVLGYVEGAGTPLSAWILLESLAQRRPWVAELRTRLAQHVRETDPLQEEVCRG